MAQIPGKIFLPDGTYAGTIQVPRYPVSLTFGGANNDVLYIVGESSAWAIQTKVPGLQLPGGPELMSSRARRDQVPLVDPAQLLEETS